jgi:6-phosphogluconolactonase
MPPAEQYKPNIQKLPDAEALASRCLDLFITYVEQTVKEKNVFRLAIPGGRSPRRFFELLGLEKKSLSLPWDKIHLFWADERFVPHDSADSNYKLAADTFLTKVPIPKENIHPIPTDFTDLDSSAQQYEKTLRSFFQIKSGKVPKFDLIILGMGADGHIASLFANSNIRFDTEAIACAVRLPGRPINRITLSPSVIRTASRIVILVSDSEKAETLKQVFAGPPDTNRYPIHILWPVLDKVLWLIDSAAAKLL